MLFIALMRLREGKLQPAIAQRMQWEYPKDVRLVGEYWLSTNDPKVISIYETDNYDAIMENSTTWDDAFDMQIFTAVSAEDGMEWVKKTMGL